MGNMRKLLRIVGVTVAVAMVAVVVAVLLRPTNGPATTAVVDQPNPTTPTPTERPGHGHHAHDAHCLKASHHTPDHARAHGAHGHRHHAHAACAASVIAELVRL